ncbi:hypothetical protein [Bacteroides sp.]|uniref:hypothetical protein n=1 Tax=Bacteroides sp. TaxID=29523 RepID=UPI00262AF769|nr:hypothetical protein [Bacteroides sp.]MDD3040197.1 hypothetical protein [Bacteroides sp.]
MESIKTTIRQTATVYSLDIECTADTMNKSIIQRVFGSYTESNGIIYSSIVSPSIMKLISVQMSLFAEMAENGSC